MRIETDSNFLSRILRWQVRCVLQWLDPDHLAGLELIKVLDESPDDPEYNHQPPYLRGSLYSGCYLKTTKERPAQIWLYFKDIYFGVPKFLMPTPIGILRVAETLAHEVGHHVIVTRGYIYKPWEKYKLRGTEDRFAEKMAEAYAQDLLRRMTSRWHYRLARWLTKASSNILYKAGLEDYRREDYQMAAKLAFKAHILNPENEDAGQCYLHAMEKLRKKVPSQEVSAKRRRQKRR